MSSSVKGGAALKKLLAEAREKGAEDLLLRVGFLEGSTHTSKSESGKIVPTAQVAAWNEYGDPERGRVPRPFFRNMVREKSPRWGNGLANLIKLNQGDLHAAMAMMGEGIAGQLRHSINEFTDPPLKQATVKAKGFSKPLIDTGEMLRAVDYELLEGKGVQSMSSEGVKV